MKLFFGLNPTPNQISDCNLKAGSPRPFANDAGDDRRVDAKQPRVQPSRPQTARQSTAIPHSAPQPPPPNTAKAFETPASESAPQRAAIGHATRPTTPPEQPVPPVVPFPPPAASAAPEPQRTVTPEVPQATSDKPSQATQARPLESSVPEPPPNAPASQATPTPKENPQAEPQNPAMDEMRKELERLRAEIGRLKQPEETIQETNLSQEYSEPLPTPPPLPKQPATVVYPADPVAPSNDAPSIQLQAYSGKTMTITGDTIVNFSNTRTLNGDDFQFMDHTEQYRISRQGGKWMIIPGANTRNATMLNYLPLNSAETLEDGDTISISMPGSNIHKMTLTVKFLNQ